MCSISFVDHKFKHVRLMHKYKKEHEYHEQTTIASVLDAVLEIICHNDYKSTFEPKVVKKRQKDICLPVQNILPATVWRMAEGTMTPSIYPKRI